MSKFEDKSNSELYSLLKEMEFAHEKIKGDILKEVGKLEQVEKDFAQVKSILKQRIK
jgi:hypothetical protein